MIAMKQRHRLVAVTPMISTLNCFDRFSMRRSIKHYVLKWEPMGYRFSQNGYVSLLDTLDKVLLQDYDKHPLLETIAIHFRDQRDLSAFAKLLLYFNQNYNRLFVERKMCSKYLNILKCSSMQLMMRIIQLGSGTETVTIGYYKNMLQAMVLLEMKQFFHILQIKHIQ